MLPYKRSIKANNISAITECKHAKNIYLNFTANDEYFIKAATSTSFDYFDYRFDSSL